MEDTDVAIVGAGPNGLAVATHLKAAGVEHIVFGKPFSTWRDHMPSGMLLKSEAYGSNVAAPTAGFDVRDFCRVSDIDYVDRITPLELATFVGYADWYQRNLVPDVNTSYVRSLARTAKGFVISGDDGFELRARRVVVATGLIPFANIPTVLSSLPADLVSHSSVHTGLEAFSGRRIGVVGGGQSALEVAALLNEAGAETEVIARTASVYFHSPMSERKGLWVAVRQPATPLCEGLHCWAYYTFPGLFRSLPERERLLRARTFLGPAGASWLRPRIEGHVPMRTGTSVIEARSVGSQVKLVLDNGEREEVCYDHVIAGTGYRVDLERLGYLSDELRKGVRVAGGAPVLTRSFESTVPNLFFVGAMAAPSLGPVTRFLAGTRFTARRLAQRLSSHHKPSVDARLAQRLSSHHKPSVDADSADAGVDLSSATSL